MPATKSKFLSSLFRSSASKLAQSHKTTPTATATATHTVADVALKQYVSAIKTSSKSAQKRLTQQPPNTQSQPNCSSSSKPLSEVAVHRLKLHSAVSDDTDESSRQLRRDISSLLSGEKDLDLDYSPDTLASNYDKFLGNVLDIPWCSGLSDNNMSLSRKEMTRRRKKKWVFRDSQGGRFSRLVKMCGHELGLDETLQVFNKLGRETGLKEYNALLALCTQKARETDDGEVQLDQNYKAYQLFQSMREVGFHIEEETYGPFLKYLIDYGMVQEFYFFSDIFKHENPASLPRLAYYEMLLCIRVNNKDKIQELCYENALQVGEDKSLFQENYLLALCESDHRREFLMLLETFDITKLSSVERIVDIFRSLGKLLLESYAEKFMVALKTNDTGANSLSNFIYNYAISIPNLTVEDVVSKFKQLHSELEVTLTSVQYEKLIKHSCESLKVHVALDIADEVFNAGFTLSLETFLSILDACEKSHEYNLITYQKVISEYGGEGEIRELLAAMVRRIYSMIQRHGLKPNAEIFRSMINLSVRMKDFEGAYNLISDLVQMNIPPTTSMYNAIMAGYFREKNFRGAFMVLKQMEDADVKPDSQTFSYLIGNCNSEEDIIKIFDEMQHSDVPVTKHVFMALINAYAACGRLDKAKMVVLDKQIPVQNLNEMKSVLVSALASHGQMADALTIYEEIKRAKCNLEPKAVISLIEHVQSEGELDRLLQLLEELQYPDYWIDGCFRVILYCVNHNHLRSAIDLLKQVKDKFSDDEVATENLFDEVFCQFAEKEPKNMQFGLDLLQAIKEEFGLRPSRKSLDFLLSACISAKDIQTAFFIWKEYQTAGLPYNVLSFVRMYQTLLALGDEKSAANILNKLPKDDPHVCSVIKACQATYTKTAFLKGTKKKKKEEKEARG